MRSRPGKTFKELFSAREAIDRSTLLCSLFATKTTGHVPIASRPVGPQLKNEKPWSLNLKPGIMAGCAR